MTTGAGTTYKERNIAIYSWWKAEYPYMTNDGADFCTEWRDYPSESNYFWTDVGSEPLISTFGTLGDTISFYPNSYLTLNENDTLSYTNNFALFVQFGINEAYSDFYIQTYYGNIDIFVDGEMNLWVYYTDNSGSFSVNMGVVPIYGEFVMGMRTAGTNVYLSLRGAATSNKTAVLNAVVNNEIVSLQNAGNDYFFVKEIRMFNDPKGMGPNQFNSMLANMTP